MAQLKIASSNAVTVEKGVPIPPKKGAPSLYPLREMEVGDSFGLDFASIRKVRSAVVYEQQRSSRRFTVRTLPTEIRCWRTA